MDILRLAPEDCRLLAARFAEHGNSHRQMAGALREQGRGEAADLLGALRRMEVQFGIDLGNLCHRALRCEENLAHPLERAVLSYVAGWRPGPDGEGALCVWVERVRQVRGWIEEGELVRKPEA